MVRSIEHQLNSITAFFQSPLEYQPEVDGILDSLALSFEDKALDFMNLGLSYLNRGLYSDAAHQFSTALAMQTQNLPLSFYEDFFPNDSLLIENLLTAFQFQTKNVTMNSSAFFFLALLQAYTVL